MKETKFTITIQHADDVEPNEVITDNKSLLPDMELGVSEMTQVGESVTIPDEEFDVDDEDEDEED